MNHIAYVSLIGYEISQAQAQEPKEDGMVPRVLYFLGCKHTPFFMEGLRKAPAISNVLMSFLPIVSFLLVGCQQFLFPQLLAFLSAVWPK